MRPEDSDDEAQSILHSDTRLATTIGAVAVPRSRAEQHPIPRVNLRRSSKNFTSIAHDPRVGRLVCGVLLTGMSILYGIRVMGPCAGVWSRIFHEQCERERQFHKLSIRSSSKTSWSSKGTVGQDHQFAYAKGQTSSWDLLGENHREQVLRQCGEVCDTSISGSPGQWFNKVHKVIDCKALLRNEYADAQAGLVSPLSQIPGDLINDYSLGGESYLLTGYRNEPDQVMVLTKDSLDEMIANTRKEPLDEAATTIRDFLAVHSDLVHDRHLLAIASGRPWLEIILLLAGAAKVTSLRASAAFRSTDPRLSAITTSQLRKQFRESGGSQPRFDGVVSISALGRKGLGSEGEMLNPWADLQALAAAWCVTVSSGPLFLGLSSSEADEVIFNSHRVYGPVRWPQIAANWRQRDMSGELWVPPGTVAPVVTLFERAECFSVGFKFLPLDMPGQLGSTEKSAAACQKRCMLEMGCEHFSFWPGGDCHLQDVNAKRIDVSEIPADASVTVGPRECSDG